MRVVGKLAVFAVILITAAGTIWWTSGDKSNMQSTPDEFVENIILKQLSQHPDSEQFVNLKLSEIKTRHPWTHFCLIGRYGKGEDVEEYARSVHVDIQDVYLWNYFDYPGEWSIVYFMDNSYFQLSFPGICISQYKFYFKCASFNAGIIKFERDRSTIECPDGSFSISAVLKDK